MSDHYNQELEEWCQKYQISGPVYNIINDFGQCTAVMEVGDGITEFGFGANEEEAKYRAAKKFLSENMGKTYAQVVDNCKRPKTESSSDEPPQKVLKSEPKDAVKYLREYCTERELPLPECHETHTSNVDDKKFYHYRCQMETTDGILLKGTGRSTTQREARLLAAQEVLQHLKQLESEASAVTPNADVKPTPESMGLVSDTSNSQSSDVNPNSNTSLNISGNTTPKQSPDVSTGMTAAGVPEKKFSNPIGYLNEFAIKTTRSYPQYEEIMDNGINRNTGNREFIIKCSLTVNGTVIAGEGSARSKAEAKRIAARKVIDLLEQKQSQVSSSGVVSADAGTGGTVSDTDRQLMQYFRKYLFNSPELRLCLTEDSDYCKLLDKIASIIDCALSYVDFGDNDTVMLKLIANNLDNPLLITYGSSSKGVEASKRIAAKKAILVLKLINNNE